MAISAITDNGVEELPDMLAEAWQTIERWHSFLDDFVSDLDVIVRVKGQTLR